MRLARCWLVSRAPARLIRQAARHCSSVGPNKKRLKQLAAETVRQIKRTHKKVVKARQTGNTEAAALQDRLCMLNEFEAALHRKPLVDDVEQIAAKLGIAPATKDAAPPAKRKKPKVRKGARLPYRTYTSIDGIQIFVGKQSEDNDELSTNNKYRAKSEWWLHASGCPGSHVVVKCSDEAPPAQTIKDAAALAARHSRFGRAKAVKVSLTRCRDVVKRAGAPPGQVELTGRVDVVAVDMRVAAERLARLDGTRGSSSTE